MAPLPPQFSPSITRTLAMPYKASLLQQSNFPPSVRPSPCSSKKGGGSCPEPLEGRKIAALAVSTTAARTLFDVFINRLLPLHPIFRSAELEEVFARVYLQGGKQSLANAHSQRDLFITSVVFAISGSVNQSYDLSRSRSFHASLLYDTLSVLSCIQHTSLESLQCLLLLVQHTLLNPQYGSLYNLIGDAMKMATALGLHQEPVCLDSSECELRRRLFWVVCNNSRLGLLSINCDSVMSSTGPLISPAIDRWRCGTSMSLSAISLTKLKSISSITPVIDSCSLKYMPSNFMTSPSIPAAIKTG